MYETVDSSKETEYTQKNSYCVCIETRDLKNNIKMHFLMQKIKWGWQLSRTVARVLLFQFESPFITTW